MFFVDNYSHPVPNVSYIKESILGPGIDYDDFYSWFKMTCSCSLKYLCVDDRCHCISTTGKNYTGSFLNPDKLDRKSIFECGPFCSCNFTTCPNRVVQKGPNSRLELKFLGTKGYGLFTLDTIPPGTFICEYAGELISKEVALSRCENSLNAHYIMIFREHYGDNLIVNYIDAYRSGNIGRYINHSCSPNCTVIPVRIGCIIPHAAVFTTKTVQQGEELTYSYGEASSGESEWGSPCYCGSLNCSGFLPANLIPK